MYQNDMNVFILLSDVLQCKVSLSFKGRERIELEKSSDFLMTGSRCLATCSSATKYTPAQFRFSVENILLVTYWKQSYFQ